MDFVKTCLYEIEDYNFTKLRYDSIAVRLAQLEEKDFKTFIEEELEENIKHEASLTIDHEKQLEELKGLMTNG